MHTYMYLLVLAEICIFTCELQLQDRFFIFFYILGLTLEKNDFAMFVSKNMT